MPSIIRNKENNFFTKLEQNEQGSLYNWIDWPVIEGFTIENTFLIGKQLRIIHDRTRAYRGSTKAIRKIDAEWIDKVAKPSLLKRKMLDTHLSVEEKIKLEKNLNG